MTSADLSYDRLAGRPISRCETHSGLCDRLIRAGQRVSLAFNERVPRAFLPMEALPGRIPAFLNDDVVGLLRRRIGCSRPCLTAGGHSSWHGA